MDTNNSLVQLNLKDINRYSEIKLTGDTEKDLKSLEKICYGRKTRARIIDSIMSSKRTEIQ